MRYEYDVHREALSVRNGNQFGFAAARGAFWIDPETLELLQIDMEGYDIPARLALRSAVDHTMYWQVLIGQRKVLLAPAPSFC